MSEPDRDAAIARADAALTGADDTRRAALVARTALRTTRTLTHARRVIAEQPVMADDVRAAALALIDTTTEEETDE